MNEGRVEQDGTPEELYFHPVNRFVAETNFLTGTVLSAKNGKVVLDWFGHKLQGYYAGSAPQEGDLVTASLRLESLTLHNTRPADRNAVKGRVTNKVFKGSRLALNLVVEETGGAILKAYVDAETAERTSDGTIWISWESQAMSVLLD